MYFTALTLPILMHDIRRKQLNILKTIHRKLFSLVVIFCLITVSAHAAEWEERTVFEGNSGKVTLRVLSSTDTAIFSPMIKRYLDENTEVNIEYLVASSSDIYKATQNVLTICLIQNQPSGEAACTALPWNLPLSL